MKKNNVILSATIGMLLSSSVALADSNYPAADFQPQVLFNDASANSSAVKNQPHIKSTSSVTKAEVAETKATAKATTSAVAAPEVTQKEESSSSSLLALLALAAAGGFLFFKKQGATGTASVADSSSSSSSAASSASATYGKHPSGLSGVARYLKTRELASASGVARYLAKKELAASSNTVQAKADDKALTGVARYLKNRG